MKTIVIPRAGILTRGICFAPEDWRSRSPGFARGM